MTREEFIKIIDDKIRLIRSEKMFSQDKMASILGISKKTLLQIEKGRATTGWTTSVAICTIFKDSEVLRMTFGGDADEIILSLAFENYIGDFETTLGGKVWWTNIEIHDDFRIQQNIISQHYRILDSKDRRVVSSFDLEYLKGVLKDFMEDSLN